MFKHWDRKLDLRDHKWKLLCLVTWFCILTVVLESSMADFLYSALWFIILIFTLRHIYGYLYAHTWTEKSVNILSDL